MTEELKSNLYEFKGNRFEILYVEYDRKDKCYIAVSADFRNVDQGKLKKKSATYEIQLPFLLNMCRNELWFTADMASYIDPIIEDQPAPTPAPIQSKKEAPVSKHVSGGRK
jgi:hypothetical protein